MLIDFAKALMPIFAEFPLLPVGATGPRTCLPCASLATEGRLRWRKAERPRLPEIQRQPLRRARV